jgi:hypothetical protein
MITDLTKAALENLWHRQRACADCIERCWQGEACPALRAKVFEEVCTKFLLRNINFIVV